jgi:thiopurine S-methyltransferase
VKREDWELRWREKRIAFHQSDFNRWLVKYADRFPATGRVLVPLCGKTRDMLWLRDRGFEVVGVEFIEEACAAFFEENQIPSTKSGRSFSGGGITIWNDDIFALDPAALGTFDWIYDRAALIALNEPDRYRYAKHMLRFSKHILLLAVFYDVAKMGPPPFSVAPTDVEWLYEGASVEKVVERDVIDEGGNARFRERGLDWLIEHVWIITSPSA